MKKLTFRFRKSQSIILWILVMLMSISLVGCDPPETVGSNNPDGSLPTVDYSPQERADWDVSNPEENGLDPDLVEDLYREAEDLDTLYSLLLVKNGVLVAEKYFNGASRDESRLLQSVSKSMVSALAGIALEEGCLSGVDQKMIEFFPEIADQVTDPSKKEITLRQMLQMRSGYPDEETDPAFLEALYQGVYTPLVEGFPLVSPPGASFNYSNLTYSWLAVILQQACGTDLRGFSQEHLFGPLDAEVGDWLKDAEGNYVGSGGIHLTPREAAKFGQLFLDDGKYHDQQIVPAAWVDDSLKIYSPGAKDYGWGFPFGKLDYGYGWWHASVKRHDFWFAWGHGGQLIVLLDDLDLVIVTTADPFFGQHDGDSWKHEKAVFGLVGDFIDSLP